VSNRPRIREAAALDRSRAFNRAPVHCRTSSAATLIADGDQTILVVEVKGMPLDKIAFYGAGWQIHAENLANYLGGGERGDTEARWAEFVPPYQNLAAKVG
jgi:hypothetical protein